MIRNVTIPASYACALGFGDVRMRDLGSVVVLAGPNGGGKTRLLRCVKASADFSRAARHQLATLNQGWDFEKAPSTIREQYLRNKEQADWVDYLGESVTIHHLETESLAAVTRYSEPTDAVAQGAFKQLSDEPHVKVHAQQGLTLHWLARAKFLAKHPDYAATPEHFAAELQATDLVESLVGKPLGYQHVGQSTVPTFDGREWTVTELSVGERLLVGWALYLYTTGVRALQGSVLLVDEPERALHGAACIDVLERLRRAVGPEGQVWVATHSPSVVARYRDQSIYYVRDSHVDFISSRLPELMDGLLGGAEAREGLRACLTDLDDFAFQKFAAEALLAPAVESARQGGSDPQESVVVRRLRAHPAGAERVRILDYGAGKGRFARALAEAVPNEPERSFEYFALNDPGHDVHHRELLANVARLYPDSPETRLRTSHTEFIGDEQVDMVLMCNFLHEVPPRDWRMHLQRCAEVLREEGRVLLIEARELTVGEMAHDAGFLVLDTDEVRLLFNSPRPREIVDDQRIVCVDIPKACIANVTPETIRKALTKLAERALQRIDEVRKASDLPVHQRGRRHSYYAMLHINATLALRA